MKLRRLTGLTVSAILALACGTRAEELFNITATPTTGSPISVSGKSVIDLVDAVVNTQNQFSSLENQDFSSSLKYAGLENAITFSQTGSSSNRSVTLTIPSTGFSKTFVDGADGKSVEDQVEDFLKKDGSEEVSKFIAQMNKLTLAGVTDGNPLATTSVLARQTFNQFGLHTSPINLRNDRVAKASAGGYEFRIDGSYGNVDTDTGNGYFGTISLNSNWRFNDTVSLAISSPITYRDLEGSQIFQAAMIAGLPIRIIPGNGDKTLSWTLTPHATIGASGSADLVSGGLLWGAGITSSLSYSINTFTLTLANQWSTYHGFGVTFGDYEFETDVDQNILRNGIQIQKAFGNFFIDAGIAYTNLLNDAAVDNYWSPSVGLGWAWGGGDASGFRIGYAGDIGDGFTVHGVDASLFFSW